MAHHSMTNYSDLLLADREEKIKQYVIHLQSNGVSKSKFIVDLFIQMFLLGLEITKGYFTFEV